MPRKPKPEAEKTAAWWARRRRWYHNSLLGGAAMGRKNMNAVMDSDTTTVASKQLACEINISLARLEILLKERVDG